MHSRILFLLIAAVALVLVGRASVFTVSEGQLAIKSTGGEIIASDPVAVVGLITGRGTQHDRSHPGSRDRSAICGRKSDQALRGSGAS